MLFTQYSKTNNMITLLYIHNIYFFLSNCYKAYQNKLLNCFLVRVVKAIKCLNCLITQTIKSVKKDYPFSFHISSRFLSKTVTNKDKRKNQMSMKDLNELKIQWFAAFDHRLPEKFILNKFGGREIKPAKDPPPELLGRRSENPIPLRNFSDE